MNVRVASGCAVRTPYARTPWAVLCARASPSIRAMHVRPTAAKTLKSARCSSALVELTHCARMLRQGTTVFVLKDIELNQIHKSHVNR